MFFIYDNNSIHGYFDEKEIAMKQASEKGLNCSPVVMGKYTLVWVEKGLLEYRHFQFDKACAKFQVWVEVFRNAHPSAFWNKEFLSN